MFAPYRIYNEEHELFRRSVAEFTAKEIVPFDPEWEKQQMVTREIWQKLGENGFLCMQVDEQYGGLGLKDFRYSAIFIEEVGKTGCAGPSIGFSLHTDIVCPYLEHYGTEELKKRLLPDCVAGNKILAVAMTEPGAGSDLQGIKTTAEDKGDHYLINGSKTFITNGYLSDVAVVAVKTNPALGAKGISLLIIEEGMEGFTKGRPFHKMGLHSQDTCELFFDNVKVPKGNLLGKEGEGFKYLMTELAQERLVVAIGALAQAEGVFLETVEYTKTRMAFGKSISDLQNTRFKLAELFGDVQEGRMFVERCIELHCEGKLDAAMASMAKQRMTDMQCRVADECVQLHGGYGYIWEYRAARAYADARVQRIYAGTNEIMKELVARKVLA
jgi:acyl-CoA dehydrogenase